MMRLGLLTIAALVVLAALWFGLRPPPTPVPTPVPGPSSSSASPSSASEPAPTVSAAAAPRRFELQPPPAGAAAPVLQAQVGDAIELQITSPQDDELHLHGYDLSLALRAGVPGTLRFEAAHAGRFDLELHHANVELAVLEISPR